MFYLTQRAFESRRNYNNLINVESITNCHLTTFILFSRKLFFKCILKIDKAKTWKSKLKKNVLMEKTSYVINNIVKTCVFFKLVGEVHFCKVFQRRKIQIRKLKLEKKKYFLDLVLLFVVVIVVVEVSCTNLKEQCVISEMISLSESDLIHCL